MHTTHGSSDLSIEMPWLQGDTGGTIAHPKPPNPKPPPPPLHLTPPPSFPLHLGPPPPNPPPPLPNDALPLPLGPLSQTLPPTQSPCVLSAAAPQSGIPIPEPSPPIEHWCNYRGLGGCAPADVHWKVSHWFWFGWERRITMPSPLQWWWRYRIYRCQRCYRLHKYYYEASLWHFDPYAHTRWIRHAGP